MHVLSSRFLPKWLVALASIAAIAFASCAPQTVQPNPQVFASLRVMDFAPSPAANVDVYWWAVGQPEPTSTKDANIHNLGYGGGAVYTNGIKADINGTQYHYRVTRLNSPTVIEKQGDMTLYAGKSATLVITTTGGLDFVTTVIPDAGAAKSTPPTGLNYKPTYVRFMNMQPGTGKLVLRLNDPISGDVIGSRDGTPGIDFNQFSDYQGISTAIRDTSYTFYLTPVNSSDVLARLTYQTYTPGSYFTIVYSGDTTRIPDDLAKLDTASAKLDRLRLRVFPDDNVGADQTNPLDSAFRYNVINGVFSANGYYQGVTQLGITVNGDQIPYLHNFTMYPVDMFSANGSNPKDLGNGVWDIHFLSTNIPTHPIEVKGSALDAAGKSHTIFDLNGTASGIDQSKINADTTISILLVNGNADPTKSVKHFEIGIPAKVSPDSITLVFVSGIALPVGGTDPKTTFHVNAGGNTMDLGPMTVGDQDVQIVTIPKEQGSNIQITDEIGVKNKVPGSSVSFPADAGGIYEIVSVGVRPEFSGPNKILVIQTNRKE